MNFVLLDWDKPEDKALGKRLGLTYHPNFAAVAPNSDEVVDGIYLAPRGNELRAMIEELLAEYGS